jgi:phosphoglucomutase/phosphomannomutase
MELLMLTKEGFSRLDVSEKVKSSDLANLSVWLTSSSFAEHTTQIGYLIEAGKWDMLLDSFYQVIPFGTGGRRGPVGIGPNRINAWTIQASAQGHSQYLLKLYGEAAQRRGVIMTFDVRAYSQKGIYSDAIPNPVKDLDGWKLAQAAAEVYAANGIKTYLFGSVRSTPELSFAIRHLKAIAGDMFSASHNLPPDNGKKVYDEHGGQLIPPHDQTLVDEVTGNVQTIKRLTFEEARRRGLIQIVGEEIDRAYQASAGAVSLSSERSLKIFYSPLHGTGVTTVYPVLQSLGFDVTLCPATSNLSGAFEKVAFNIPNPEVVESFNTSLPLAQKAAADILLSTDPDADRIGIMVNHRGQWLFLTGNEIAIILTNYAINRLRAAGRLTPQRVIVKTDVTTALIDTMARANNIACLGDLLVGFKYVAEEMNKLEAAGPGSDFIFGCEESHGYLTGTFARDKDAANAAVWIAKYAAELKRQGRTLVDSLDEIYTANGYCHNYLTEIRLLEANSMEQNAPVTEHFHSRPVHQFGDFNVAKRRNTLEPQGKRTLGKESKFDKIGIKINNLLDGLDLEHACQRKFYKEAAIRLFYSYSHKDERLIRELETQLKLLQRLGIITVWHDRKIEAGDDWREQIDENLEKADIILLLISADFIASDYCYEYEMTRALERHKLGKATVIPIIARDVNWKRAPFARLKALPNDGKPVKEWRSKDAAWRNVCEGIERVVMKIRKERKRSFC